MKAILLILLIVMSAALFGCSVQYGTVKDKVFSVDTGLIWNHVYFVNDHTTTYCLDRNNVDDYNYLRDSNDTVRIDYEKTFFGRGAWCTPQGNNEAVVITKVYR